MEIREYLQYNEAEILSLYSSVGWTAYTDSPEALRRGFGISLLTLAAYEGDRQRKGIGSALIQGFQELSELGCCASMKI